MRFSFFFIFLFGINFINAQDFEVAPVVLNYNANPGEIQQSTVTIRNHANIKQAFTFIVGDFEVDENGQKKRMPAGTSSRSCADWITINPSLLELNPNEERQINVIITVPKDGFASKWAMIYAQAATEQKENPVDKELGTGIRLTPRIVILVTQSPKVNNNYKAGIKNLKEITTIKDSLRTFEMLVENNGDKIIEAKVNLAIGNMLTGKEEKFPGTMRKIYPGEKRKYLLTIPDSIAPGEYALLALLNYGHGTNLEGDQIIISIE